MTITARRLTDLPRMTLDEFLAWDGGRHAGKLELWNGVVRAMAPASADRAITQSNIAAAINVHLRARASPCRVGTEAPVVPPMAAPQPKGRTFDGPVLIVEVMSPGDENATWDGIQSLAGLAALKEVRVVQSASVRAGVYRRDAVGGRPRTPISARDGGSARLESTDLDLGVADNCDGTTLAQSQGGA